MPQNPFLSNVAIDPDGVRVALNVDADGNLVVASASGGDAVTIADGADVALGTTTDNPWTLGAGTAIALLKAIAGKAISAFQVRLNGLKYVTCAASTTQALGTGAIGDTLNSLLIVPGTLAAGTVQIKDGGGSAINVFVAGTLADLKPFTIPLNALSAAGGWSIITGANVTAIATGQFTP